MVSGRIYVKDVFIENESKTFFINLSTKQHSGAVTRTFRSTGQQFESSTSESGLVLGFSQRIIVNSLFFEEAILDKKIVNSNNEYAI